MKRRYFAFPSLPFLFLLLLLMLISPHPLRMVRDEHSHADDRITTLPLDDPATLSLERSAGLQPVATSTATATPIAASPTATPIAASPTATPIAASPSPPVLDERGRPDTSSAEPGLPALPVVPESLAMGAEDNTVTGTVDWSPAHPPVQPDPNTPPAAEPPPDLTKPTEPLAMQSVQEAHLERGGFIEVSGSQLTRLGQPVQLKGVNYYPQGRPWAEMWEAWDAPQIERELRLARDQLGINAVRVLLPYKQSYDRSSEKRVERRMLERLREMSQIVGSLDMRMIVALFDFYNDFPPPGTREEEENLIYLRTLLGNFTGDDRIFAWDLHNEPDHYPMWEQGNAQQVLGWLGRMADEVHRIAPHQLVTVGMGQHYNFWQPGPDGRRVIDYSDVISVHIYNASDAERQLYELRTYTDKPILLQEFGWPTGPPCAVHNYTEADQTEMYRTMLEAVEGRVVGVFAWTLRDYDAGPTRRWDTREEHYGLYRPDDSLKPAALIFRDYPAPPLPSHTITNVPLTSTNPRPPSGAEAPLLIAESGHYVKGAFRRAWETLGGQSSFGLPLSNAFVQGQDERGNDIVVQYFEVTPLQLRRGVRRDAEFDQLSPAEQAMRLVQPVAIGRAYAGERSFAQRGQTPAGAQRFESGYTVSGEFLAFYQDAFNRWRLGLPISEELSEDVNGTPTWVQYFEHGRLEWNTSAQVVEISRLGNWAWDRQCQFIP